MSRIILVVCLMGFVCGCGGSGQPEEPTNPDPPPGVKFNASSANKKTGIGEK
jgi:hypothetical protein